MIFKELDFGLRRLKVTYLIYYLISLALLPKISNAQIVPDSTLIGNEQSKVDSNLGVDGGSSAIISHGAIRGANLFHSFQKFNVSKDQSVYFENPSSIQNIIARVTLIDSSNISNIMGLIGVKNSDGVLGNANLFLVNPNGITFGAGASIDLGGSFVATTAHAVQFQNKGSFDVFEPNPPALLNVNPSGFLFLRENISPIIDFSQHLSGKNTYFNPVSKLLITEDLNGIRVPDNHSLILLGGPITLDGGGIYALSGRAEIASISGEGLVGLSFNNKILSLNIPSDINRDNVSLLRSARVDSSGNNSGGGSIQITGKSVQIEGGSRIVSATTGLGNGEMVSIDAINSVYISDFTPNGVISTITYSSGSAGNIKFSGENVIVDQRAQIISSTLSSGRGGDINISSAKLINVRGANQVVGVDSGIFSASAADGTGGNISLNTLNQLVLSDGASVFSGGSSQGSGGNLSVSADNSVEINNGFLSAMGSIGEAGNVNIDTKILNILDGGYVQVDSGLNKAGNLIINANSLKLDGGGILANTGISGANIEIKVKGIMSIGNESLISANASTNADGGNIKINSQILLAFSPTGSFGSDIVAIADKGRGGNIVINSKGIFGIKEGNASQPNQRNDIDASSQFGPSGQVQINSAINPTQGIEELPSTVIDPSTLVAQNPCKHSAGSEFVRSGRGGLPPSISQDIDSNSSRVELVQPIVRSAEKVESKPVSKVVNSQFPASLKIVPAQGWIYNDKGQAVLVAYNPSTSGPQRSQPAPASCPAF